MELLDVDILVVGGGAAGMAASLAASSSGLGVLLCEKENELGGILRQCFHRGFGRAVFGRELTGPEYAELYIAKLQPFVRPSPLSQCLSSARSIPASQGISGSLMVRTGACILSISPDRTALLSAREGLARIRFKHCILATGCYERTLGSLLIAGTRPAGIFTAGTAQRLENLEGKVTGHRIVILGSGDVGQIMARHFAESGREVVAMLEIKDHVGGLPRNRRDCLEACRIPVLLRTTVEEVFGTERIQGIRIRHLDSGMSRELDCDTLITAIGLIPDRTLCPTPPENGLIPDRTLCRKTTSRAMLPPWLSTSGNCDTIHDIVDSVTKEAFELGRTIASLYSP